MNFELKCNEIRKNIGYIKALPSDMFFNETVKKELSFAEQLAAARNKLKPKVDFQQKPEEPKTEKPANLMDVLKKQINLRYNNLKENWMNYQLILLFEAFVLVL